VGVAVLPLPRVSIGKVTQGKCLFFRIYYSQEHIRTKLKAKRETYVLTQHKKEETMVTIGIAQFTSPA
jgi:hypothetical protein